MQEALAQRLDAGAQDVGEAEQEREPHALLGEIHRELVEVELALGVRLVRPDDDVPLLVDVEEADAPPFDVVERPRVLDGPGGLGCCRNGIGDVGSHGAEVYEK